MSRPRIICAGHRGWLSGRGTSEVILGGPREPDLLQSFDHVPEGQTSPLFRSSGDAEPTPVEFAFRSAEPLSDGSDWLRYDVMGEIEAS
ncbi:hypothetical protein K3888_11815 [Dietzia aurantiaca]|uniref:hypothetical protein n=1 Tax=Dietzia aurantiaca TaxID=983873 RepID=UPI001E3642FF|nr:hypothetical protein [Dietzia aurantiaca]MCD2263385.1 hypothetical protein [Dietzia aurantiaca]